MAMGGYFVDMGNEPDKMTAMDRVGLPIATAMILIGLLTAIGSGNSVRSLVGGWSVTILGVLVLIYLRVAKK
jgi:uncharacterized membrane protein